MYAKNEFTITLDRHGSENEECQLPIAHDIVSDKLIDNIFVDSSTRKVYKCIGVKYLGCNIKFAFISYTFECVYIRVPVARFEEFSSIGVFDDTPYYGLAGCSDDTKV